MVYALGGGGGEGEIGKRLLYDVEKYLKGYDNCTSFVLKFIWNPHLCEDSNKCKLKLNIYTPILFSYSCYLALSSNLKPQREC